MEHSVLNRNTRLGRCLALIAIAAALSGVGSANAAVDAPIVDGGARVDQAKTRMDEAQALARDEGTTVAAATRKLEWQPRAADFIDRARAVATDDFGGAWLEDGAVHMWVKPGRESKVAGLIRSLVSQFAVGTVDLRVGKYSETALTALQAQIDGALKVANTGAPATVDVEPDVRQNRLILRVPPAPTAAQRELVAKTVAAYPEAVATGTKGVSTKLACNGPWCDPPLRGGAGLIYGSSHICTAGFVVASATDLKRYLMTQTHCIAGGNTGTWKSAFSNLGHHNIGAVHNWDTSDRAILRIDNPGGWNPGPYLRIAGNEQYAVRSLQIPAVGTRTCMTGSYTWDRNHCGTVSYGLATRDGVSNTLRAQLDSCPQAGDSGAPFFSANVAHGTLIGYYGSTGCGGVWFSSLNSLLATLNVRMVVTG